MSRGGGGHLAVRARCTDGYPGGLLLDPDRLPYLLLAYPNDYHSLNFDFRLLNMKNWKMYTSGASLLIYYKGELGLQS